ncbi:cellulose binding domain-containing protein [Solwaraspora sp. WMMD1047]|uniref:cellulose binding domain-containing protein n=1 Tax=Solwaraspora sp. WMMD1047 TaxID=3016102 RepID=UPI00241658C6|nr:cellulose binding domain-containing protein [Solwaraspora sp. WMMD1047]MDG4831880.1 cellulose binding domain-containing protein [Solwaraspora sp. WMMD1047]
MVVGAGVGAMIFLLVVAVGWVPLSASPTAAPPAQPAPQWPFAPGSTDAFPSAPPLAPGAPAPSPTGSASPPVEGSSGGAATDLPATHPTATATRTKPAPPAAPPTVTGHYQLMASYDDSFIGEVVLRNVSGVDRQWTVELRFPAGVGELRTFWVESAPQATLRRSGGLFIFTSTVALPAGSSVPLRFHIDRTGAANAPSDCRVNGTAC